MSGTILQNESTKGGRPERQRTPVFRLSKFIRQRGFQIQRELAVALQILLDRLGAT